MNLDYIEKCAKAYEGKLNEEEQGRLDYFIGLWKVMNECIESRSETKDYPMPSLAEVRELYMSGTPIFSQALPNVNAEQYAEASRAIADYILENGEYTDDVVNAVRAVDWLDLVIKQNSDHMQLDMNDLGTRIAGLVLVLAQFTFYEPITEQIMEAIRGDRMADAHPIACPVCGSGAAISIIDRNENFSGTGRELYCGRCGMSWEFDRIRCARCGCTDEDAMQFVNIGNAKNHQIQLCDNCGEFIRTTFVDPSLPEVAPIVDDIVSTPIEEIVRAGALENLEDAQE